jgi:hypothetical protein
MAGGFAVLLLVIMGSGFLFLHRNRHALSTQQS